MVLAYLEGAVTAAPDLRLWQAESDSEPDIILCAAAGGIDLRRERRTRGTKSGNRAVLYDLSGGLGVLGAGLYQFRGYCSPGASEERLLICLRRVARGDVDAPREHLATLIRLLETPPLDKRDLTILRLLALGRSNQQIAREAPIGARNLGNRLQHLETLFEAEDARHLAAIATALGLGWPFEDDMPEGVVVEKLKRGGKSTR